MQHNRLTTTLGLVTTAVIATLVVPVQARASNLQVNSGVTSVFLDEPLLESVGLDLTGASNTVSPSSDFLVGFNIAPNTNFTFNNNNGFSLIGGSIEHSGSVTFNDALTVGNFSIGFDQSRASGSASGFFVKDTITTNAVLFDIANIAPAVNGNNLQINGDLLVSQELAGVLNNQTLRGAAVGRAQTNATTITTTTVPTSSNQSTRVPEPTSALGFLAVGVGMITLRKG
ncbi:MAG: PEP-CTERM sorting domain-containing protein, partial [Calothrix sp. SM1_7_51]|nr:PEP-CTERM sorting domain-containing protein [Calothrix sp. SM1_7_51]